MQRRLSKPRRNPPGQWTSYNKVLVGSGKRPHARNPNFDWEETKLLISLWGDPKVQRTLITTHKKYPVIARIAEKMREHGYNRTPEEINTRIKNLKCFYNRVKKDLEMGVTASPNWKHYDDMDEIMSRPIFGNNARMPENPVQSESQSSQSPKDSVAHLVESEMKIKEENLSDDDDAERLNGAKNAEIEVPASSANNEFLIPKDEPLDIDDGNLLDSDMDDDFDDDFAESDGPTPNKMPKLTEITTNSLPQLDKIQSRPVEIKLIENPTSQTRTVISTQPSTPATTPSGTSGKISLVPANILLKPQAQENHQIIYTNPTIAPQQQSVIQSQTPTSNTSQPMKVLLVNAMPKTVNSNTQPTTSQTVTITATPMVQKTMPKVMPPLHPTIPPQTKISVIPQPTALPPLKPTQKTGAGFRALLTQLIQLQNENLLMQRQRLNLEKQRLDTEKQFGERICNLLTNIQRQNQLLAAKTGWSTYRTRREQKANNRGNDSTDDDAGND